tara:strand:+ start:718 stop:1113 length:396 start_codon:yes stop_codon:yes gene_type:complete
MTELQRFSAYAVDGGYDAYGQMEEDDIGDYYNREDVDAKLMTLRAEVADCHVNINTKADFIDATINQLAAADELADTLRAEVARLRLALEWYGEQVHTFATDQTGKRADVVLDLDGGSRARAALEHGEADQ